MAFEIEMKARVDDPEELEGRLHETAVYQSSFHKRDRYYRYPECAPVQGKSIRLRKEGDITYVTSKDKSVVDGMEENREIEFTVSDYDAVEILLSRLGCSPFLEKVKKGKRFLKDDLILELCEVESLGWFIEIEKIIPENDPDQVRKARIEVEEMFISLGIGKEKTESRYYTDLLMGKS